MSPPRIAQSALMAAIAALALGACGGSSGAAQSGSGSAGSSEGRQQGRGGFFSALQDPKVKACVEKQGVTVPTAPPGGGGGQGYGPPQDGQAPPTNGQGPPQDGQRGGGFGGGMNSELLKALEKCGVKLPQRQQGQGPGQTTPSRTATTNS